MKVYDADGNEYDVAGDDEEIGAVPGLSAGLSRGFGPALQRTSNAAVNRGLSPAAIQNMRRQLPPSPANVRSAVQAAAQAGFAAGVTEARARAIAQEEIRAGLSALQIVPPSPNRTGICQNPMGVGFVAFSSTSGTTLAMQAKPQRGFRGERLVIDIRRSGASANASPVILSKLTVGDYNQLVGGGPLPADIFANNSVGVRLDLDASYPGVLIDLEFTIPAPLAAGDGIFVSVGIIGSTVDITAG